MPHSFRSWRSPAAALLLSLATVSGWALANRPVDAPDVSRPFHGAAYQPYRAHQSPTGKTPSLAEIDEDLATLKHYVRAVRTYSSRGNLAGLPGLAAEHGLTVLQGVWVDGEAVRSRQEIEAAVAGAGERAVTGLLVGNEALLRRDLTLPQLTAYLDEVRKRTGKPISTAEPWAVWLEQRELARHVDFIAIHILPYWEETKNDEAIAYTIDRINEVRAAFPDKKLVIAEVGWPSGGRARWDLQPGRAAQARFLRTVLDHTERQGIEAYAMEAVDGPWKYTIEGSVGPYWGFLDAERRQKFAWRGPLWERSHWPLLAGFAAAGGLVLFLWLARTSPNRRGAWLLQAGAGFAGSSFVVWLIDEAAGRYFQPFEAAMWVLLAGLLVVLALVLSADVTEAAATISRRTPRHPSAVPVIGPVPVSIHVPIHREQPAVVAETLRALARLDWPELEVIVVDNNTTDEALWRPVERECRRLNAALGRRVFRFLHVEGLEGFKAGALNLARRHTRPDAQVIGVIDADYVVDRSWLRRAVPEFADSAVGFVQAPQDHRGAAASFERTLHWEYAGFFHVGMVNRDHDNAIIQHGTMVLIRKAALDAADGWGAWCITEDAELGLRLHAAGWRSVYIRDTLGRGLLPDDWAGYANQRHRWAYGGIRILRRHWRAFLPGSPLAPRQRLRYAAGWLPWIGDGIGILFACLSVVWTALALLVPNYIELPEPILFLPPLVAFAGRSLIAYALHRGRVPCRPLDSLGAALAGIALAPTIGRAVLHAVLYPDAPFRRTPKGMRRHGPAAALRAVLFEALLAASLLGAAVLTVWLQRDEPTTALWAGALAIQAVPPLLAVGLALLATIRGPATLAPRSAQTRPRVA